MWRYLSPITLFVVLAGFFAVGLYRDPSIVPSPFIGKQAPAFERPTVEDPTRMVSTADFAGKPYIVNVWGTWCVECRREHAVLLEIAKQNVIPIVGLNWKDDLQQAQSWLQQLGNPYAVTAFDQKGGAGIDWGVYGAPETFLIDAHGIVLYKYISPMTMEVWNREFLPRINSDKARSRS
jgi:cytochrome c biogenesis protein CcmG/thiol:disulfide interchange protein DsbE